MVKTAFIVLRSTRVKGQRFDYMVAKALEYSLKQLRIDAEIVTEEDGGEADFVFGLWDENLNLKRFERKAAIFVTSEQLPYYANAPQAILRKWYDAKERLQQYDFVFEHSLVQVNFIRQYIHLKQGPASVIHFPWGYSPMCDYSKRGKRREIPITRSLRRVHFLGGLTPRRRRIINELSRHCAISTECSYSDPGRLIRKGVISLNLHKDSRGAFAAGRVICLLLGNEGFTITEPFEEEENIPLVDKKHLVIASTTEQLKEAIWYYLEHKQERQEIATQGYEFIKQNYTMTQNLRKALLEAKLIEV